MYYTDGVEPARKTAATTLALMQKHAVAAHPMNYAVWYEYVSGKSPQLSRAVDEYLKDQVEFTPERNEQLFTRFFGTEREARAIREAGEGVQLAIREVLAMLEEAGQQSAGYQEALSELSGDLARSSGAEEVQKLVRGIVAETQKVLVRNRELEQRLGQSSREVDELREHLEAVKQDSLTDALTGIANRKCFELRLGEDARLAAQSGEGLCLMLVDIDHFKTFNDRYGHLVGDEVLRLVARSLKDNLKGRDTPARFGGEEFAVILPQTELKHGAGLADKIRAALAGSKLVNKKTGQDFGTITVSIGVAQYTPGEPLSELVERADQALYRAKRGGRNRVIVDDAEAGEEADEPTG